MPANDLRARLRLVLGAGVAIGPGKIDLLEAIDALGSIASAGRRLGMSYKRAWSLVDELNASFAAPLVERMAGGKAGGGAVLTDLGRDVARRYRRIEAEATRSAEREFLALRPKLARARKPRP
jgi:molybdate transport system regulatory protein